MNQVAAVVAVVAIVIWTPKLAPDKYPESWKQDGKGKTYVLYRKHNVTAMSQGQVGSCVGCATAKALEMMDGRKYSPEWCYGMSRDHFEHEWSRAGSYCGYAAQITRDVGVLPAVNYALMDEDLRFYSVKRAKKWARGPPDEWDFLAAKYRSPGFYKITSWEQLRDSIANGVPVIVGSSIGFGSKKNAKRSRTGMLRSHWWSRWRHAMVFCGVSDGKSKRALLLNSWGTSWVRGPKWLGDEPSGSFWVSKSDAVRMIEQGDTYAILPIPGI